ncbi:cytochrome c [Rhizobium jaguaris]|uniref:cytochrome c n=1 Tax=Rhizobium jaguaris TaxID=1312183 RepID=UPI0039BF9A3C
MRLIGFGDVFAASPNRHDRLSILRVVPLHISRPAFILGIFVATAVPAASAIAADDLVVLRQADMKAMAAAAKVIADMFRNPASYSSAEFAKAAETIEGKSGDVLAGHFAGGLDDPRSKAKPEIGGERDRFDRLASDLRDYARSLGADAADNPGPMTDRMRMRPGEAMGGGPLGTYVRNKAELSSITAEHVFHLMLQTCATCHARFRVGQ